MADQPWNPEIRLLDGQFYPEHLLEHHAWLCQRAPVYWDEVRAVWGIARCDNVTAVSRGPQAFCSRQGAWPDLPTLPSMIELDGPEHERRRAPASARARTWRAPSCA